MKFLNSFTLLAICVAAAVSGSKKAVSAVAAAVVGVGLLCSPIESVQAQGSDLSPPKVTDFCVIVSYSGGLFLECLPTFDTSDSAPGWLLGTAFPYRRYMDFSSDGSVLYGHLVYHRRDDLDNPDSIVRDSWVYLRFYFVAGVPGATDDSAYPYVQVWVEDSDGNEEWYYLDARIIWR